MKEFKESEIHLGHEWPSFLSSKDKMGTWQMIGSTTMNKWMMSILLTAITSILHGELYPNAASGMSGGGGATGPAGGMGVTGPIGPTGFAGTTGPIGPTGAAGPFVGMTPEYTFLSITGTPTINAGAAVLFPDPSIITLTALAYASGTGTLTISDTGIYMINYGVSVNNSAQTTSTWGLSIDGASPAAEHEIGTVGTSTANFRMPASQSVLLSVTNPTTVQLINNSGVGKVLTSPSGVGSVAFMTVIKIE